MKSVNKAMLAIAATVAFSVATPAMAAESSLDDLLGSLMANLTDQAIEATSSQLTESLTTALEEIQVFSFEDELEPALKKPNLPVDTTATE